MSEAIALYYAQVHGTIIFALDPEVLAFFIDNGADALPRPGQDEDEDAQFVFETRARAGGAMRTAITWLMQGEANRAQGSARAAAELLLRGAPTTSAGEGFASLASSYLGAVPVSASGRSDFSLAPDGVHDGVHGSSITPEFPQLPVEGAPVSALLQRLEGVRAEVAFDPEPGANDGARSLHTHFTLQLSAQ